MKNQPFKRTYTIRANGKSTNGFVARMLDELFTTIAATINSKYKSVKATLTIEGITMENQQIPTFDHCVALKEKGYPQEGHAQGYTASGVPAGSEYAIAAPTLADIEAKLPKTLSHADSEYKLEVENILGWSYSYNHYLNDQGDFDGLAFGTDEVQANAAAALWAELKMLGYL